MTKKRSVIISQLVLETPRKIMYAQNENAMQTPRSQP